MKKRKRKLAKPVLPFLLASLMAPGQELPVDEVDEGGPEAGHAEGEAHGRPAGEAEGRDDVEEGGQLLGPGVGGVGGG